MAEKKEAMMWCHVTYLSADKALAEWSGSSNTEVKRETMANVSIPLSQNGFSIPNYSTKHLCFTPSTPSLRISCPGPTLSLLINLLYYMI